MEIIGISRSEQLPPSNFYTAYRQYEQFAREAGLKAEEARWAQDFAEKTVPLYLFNSRVIEARVVKKNKTSRDVLATLPLQAPQSPDVSLLEIVEPERMAAPSQTFGPDVVGLRLGMSFDEAERIIRDHMKVGRLLEANRAWQTKAASGDIQPYTSGRLYESEDGRELIILHDEPPAMPGVVLGLIRQVSFPKGTVQPAAVYASLREKYGNGTPLTGGAGLLWLRNTDRQQTELSSHCRPGYRGHWVALGCVDRYALP